MTRRDRFLNRCARERAQVLPPLRGVDRRNGSGQRRRMICGLGLQSSWGMTARFLQRSGPVRQPFDAGYY